LNYRFEDEVIALAGVFQAAGLVHRIAREGQCAPEVLTASLQSLFVTSPDQVLHVFGDGAGIRPGLATLEQVMGPQAGPEDAVILRYGLNMIHLEARLNRRPDMLAQIAERIEQARRGVEHFSVTHPNVIANLADLYQDTISTFRQRIRVVGDPAHLQVEENAARIRALLLAGIRAAVLWRQTGGRRWQLIFKRRKVVETARKLGRNVGIQ